MLHTRHRRRCLACGCASLALALAPPARAAGHEVRRNEPLVLSLEVGGALLGAGAVYYLVPPPKHCRWCEPPAFDEALHTPAAPEDRRAAAAVSHLFSMVLLPAGGIATALVPPLTTSEPDRHAPENLAIVSEAVFLNVAVTLAVKVAVARRRPGYYYGRQANLEFARTSSQENLSFISGDSSVAFAAAAATSTLAFVRGYDVAPYVTAASSGLALSTALLRVAADVHWPSDVLIGALVGTGIGIGMPLLLHGRARAGTAAQSSALAAPPAAPAPAFGISGRF